MSNYRYIFIDESQDISLNEYELIKNIYNNNTVFNIYGDTNQMTSPKRGINNWGGLKRTFNAVTYNLNENYRNTIEVTNYCADNLGIKAMPIGLHGPTVKTMNKINTYELLRMLNEDITMRTAYIVEEFTNSVNFIIKQLGRRANIIKDENSHIKPDKIN